MAIEIKVPTVGESISEVEIGGWLKAAGDVVRRDEPLVTLESEKATIELPCPEEGTLTRILKQRGEVARIGEVIAYMETGQLPISPAPEAAVMPGPAPAASAKPKSADPEKQADPRIMPAAQVLLSEHRLQAKEIPATGPGGRLLKEDVLRHIDNTQSPPIAPEREATTERPPYNPQAVGREEETVPMSRLRRTVAERLVQAQHTAALLTTFNEIDMTRVMGLRKEFGEVFQQKYEVKLGFMSFFVKACVEALKIIPALNAEVRGTSVVYHNFYDIGVAVGSGKGLVVPVLRNAEHMSFSDLEKNIGDFGRRAKENKLKVDELQGGTFTISNGGVYGSMLSTPIVNPPQSGVLGMHAIQERPVAREGAVVIRPMMYVALTYDHRIVDGREAVSFLKRVKDLIEDPTRILLEI